MTAIFVNEQELVKQIVEYVEQDEIAIAVKKLRQQAANSRELLPLWLLNTADALEKNDWDILSEGFINKDFIGKEALRQTQLEMLKGEMYQHPYYWAAFIPSGDWTPMDK